MTDQQSALGALLEHNLLDVRNATIRNLLNQAVYSAWLHAEKHGDITGIQRIVDAFPTGSERAGFVRRLKKTYPLTVSLQDLTRLRINRLTREQWTCPDAAPDVTGLGTLAHASVDGVMVGKVEFAPDELLSLLSDHLTLNRAHLSIDQIDRLIDLLNTLKTRKTAQAASRPKAIP